MVPPEKLKPTTPLSQTSALPLVGSTGIIQLFGHCIATWLWAWLDSDPKN